MIGNNYFESGMINTEFNSPFQVNEALNPLFDSSFDDGVGGLFNQTINYSNSFKIISTPAGYSTSTSGNDIIESGNIAPLEGDGVGVGYENKKPLMELWSEVRTSGNPPKYIENGINIQNGFESAGSFNLQSFFSINAPTGVHIPMFNDFLHKGDGSGLGFDGTGNRRVPSSLGDFNGTTI